MVESVTSSVPECDTVELASFFGYSVVRALVEGKVVVTAPVVTNGTRVISSSLNVAVGCCVPSVAVQTASVVPESIQVPETVLEKIMLVLNPQYACFEPTLPMLSSLNGQGRWYHTST